MLTRETVNDAYFDRLAGNRQTLTYDDVTEMPAGYSDVSYMGVDTSALFSLGIELKRPLVPAAMDYVTGSKMAIAIARLGGIAVIPYNLSEDQQRKEVRVVKNAQRGLIDEPVGYHEDVPLKKILDDRPDLDSDFWSYLVRDNEGRLVGMLNKDDFMFAEDHDVTAGKAMKPLEDLLTAPVGTTKEEAYEMMRTRKVTKLPLLYNGDASHKDGTVAGLYTFSDVSRLIRGNPEEYTIDEDGRLRVAGAVPWTEDAMGRVQAMLRYGVDAIVLDSSQGYTEPVLNRCREIKAAWPNLQLVVGNIANPASVEPVIEAGADAIKVGIGPGSICTTRRELGIGIPQITAIHGCARASHESKRPVPICADGGIVFRGDISKAIAAGADTIMSGFMFAGTDENPIRPVTLDDGTKYVPYRGQGSEGAMLDSAAAKARYDQAGGSRMPVPQGVEAAVAYKGPVADVVKSIDEQLRKSMAACNARTIEEHQHNTELWQTTAAGQKEAHSHDVTIITSR